MIWPETWHGANPLCLMVVTDAVFFLDLDEPQWKTTYKHIFYEPAEWYLVRKNDHAVVLALKIWEGEQPYYVARHIGQTDLGEVTAYGIGKKARRKRKDRWVWNEDNLWYLPWGQVCGGNDVEWFALEGLKKGLTAV